MEPFSKNENFMTKFCKYSHSFDRVNNVETSIMITHSNSLDQYRTKIFVKMGNNFFNSHVWTLVLFSKYEGKLTTQGILLQRGTTFLLHTQSVQVKFCYVDDLSKADVIITLNIRQRPILKLPDSFCNLFIIQLMKHAHVSTSVHLIQLGFCQRHRAAILLLWYTYVWICNELSEKFSLLDANLYRCFLDSFRTFETWITCVHCGHFDKYASGAQRVKDAFVDGDRICEMVRSANRYHSIKAMGDFGMRKKFFSSFQNWVGSFSLPRFFLHFYAGIHAPNWFGQSALFIEFFGDDPRPTTNVSYNVMWLQVQTFYQNWNICFMKFFKEVIELVCHRTIVIWKKIKNETTISRHSLRMFVCFVRVILSFTRPTQAHSFFHSTIAPFINSLRERLEHAKFTPVQMAIIKLPR